MRVMIYLGQGGLRSLSASSRNIVWDQASGGVLNKGACVQNDSQEVLLSHQNSGKNKTLRKKE